MTNDIFVYVELNKNNNIKPVSLQLISKAMQLKTKLADSKVIACIISYNQDWESISKIIGNYGADEIIIADDEKLSLYNNSLYPEVFTRLVKKYEPSIVLLGATTEGKEIASYTSTKLETGLTADCTGLDISQDGKLISTRPTFGGQLIADIMCRTLPQMATVQENVFGFEIKNNNAVIIHENIDLSNIENKVELLSSKYKDSSPSDVGTSKILVSMGLGAASEKGYKLVKELSDTLNAALSGSREAYEKGFITKSQQIGQTGKTVAPRLYIAIGISGANQHLTGIKNSGKIIAVNKDKNAPIFQHSDIGIVGDLYEVIPELIRIIQADNKEE